MISTSRKFPFVASHSLPGRSQSAAHLHWHSYVATFTTLAETDQDYFIATLCSMFRELHGAYLNELIADTSDEGIAQWLLKKSKEPLGITQVRLETDGQREVLAR